jgi:hypothetical protein
MRTTTSQWIVIGLMVWQGLSAGFLQLIVIGIMLWQGSSSNRCEEPPKKPVASQRNDSTPDWVRDDSWVRDDHPPASHPKTKGDDDVIL